MTNKFSFIKEFSKFAIKKLNIKDHFNRKYSEEIYVNEIVNVLRSSCYWRRYTGVICGRILNNKHNIYVKNGLYKEFYKRMLDKYLQKNRTSKLKYQSIDSSFIQNKFGTGKIGRNKYYKNKKGIKLSSIVDVNGIPLSIFVDSGNIHDAKLFNPTCANMLIVTNSRKYKNHNRYKQYFLADKGYDSKKIKHVLVNNGYIPLIAQNRRNIKDTSKLIKFNTKDELKYKKRIIVENYYAWIKMYPKLSQLYEKNISSYISLVYLANTIIITSRI